MDRKLAHVTLLVRDYDEAIDFYTGKLRFDLIAARAGRMLLFLQPEFTWRLPFGAAPAIYMFPK